jgi:hypothetical protein
MRVSCGMVSGTVDQASLLNQSRRSAQSAAVRASSDAPEPSGLSSLEGRQSVAARAVRVICDKMPSPHYRSRRLPIG